VSSGLQGPAVLKEVLVPLDYLDYLERLGFPEQRDQRDLLVRRVLTVRLEALVLPDLLDQLEVQELQDLMGQPECRVVLVLLAHPVLKGRPADRALAAQQVSQVRPVRQDPQDHSELRARQGLLDCLEVQDLQVPREYQDQRDLLVLLECLEQPAHLVQLEFLVALEHLDLRVILEALGSQAHWAARVYPVQPVRTVLPVQLVQLVLQDPLDLQATLVVVVQLEHPEQLGTQELQVVPVIPACRGQQVHLEQRDL